MKKVELFLELGGTKKDIAFLCISGVSLILSLLKIVPLPFDIAWVAIIFCGVPIVLEAIIGLVTEFDIKADVLVSLALIASVCIHEDFAAGEIAFIMQLGALLEDLTVAKARSGIEKLVKLTPQTARVLKNGKENVVPAEDVSVGDTVRVLPGESIPVDGIITSGETSVDQSVMTGESMPVDKTVGDEVSSGTVNRFGAFEMKATKVGSDSSIQRMIRLVQSADAGKAKIVSFADKFATWIVVIALVAAVLTFIFSGKIIRAVTILVVFCPCALVLATPTAIMAAIGNATKHGFLVREGDALERLSKVSVIAFDKTGTLTYGTPKVTTVKSVNGNYSDSDVFFLATCAEQLSEHPLGKAIVKSYNESETKPLVPAYDFKMIPGKGACASIGEKTVLAGNFELLSGEGIKIEKTSEIENFLESGCTVIYLAADSEYIGYAALSDTPRENAKDTIKSLFSLGTEPVLLTGDNEKAAKSVASKLGIKNVKAECLPETKLEFIDNCEKGEKPVCMIGDGINDAPALKRATVGIAMGGIGSDIAVDAADIALVNDDISELPFLKALSLRMMKTIKLNLTFSMTLNFVAITLAIIGTLNPVIGALVHNAGSILVIINSALLLKWRNKK